MWTMPEQPLETLRMRIELPGEIRGRPGPRAATCAGSTARTPRGCTRCWSTATGEAAAASSHSTRGSRHSTGDSEFDPELCFLVEVGDELAAAAICWTSAFVKDIVVHESWRRRGFGESLLRLAFRTFQARGARQVELKVQAQNSSAIRLYERVGMRVVERISEQPGG